MTMAVDWHDAAQRQAPRLSFRGAEGEPDIQGAGMALAFEPRNGVSCEVSGMRAR